MRVGNNRRGGEDEEVEDEGVGSLGRLDIDQLHFFLAE
jgi:hypothetical protein